MIFVILLLCCGVCVRGVGVDAGLLFRSYDVPAERRTAMVVSGPHGSPLHFDDSLSFSFSLKIDLDKGRFGYVFRLAIDDMLPVDFLLSPKKGRSLFCITADHKNVIDMDSLLENVEEWNDIHINAVEKADSIVFYINSVKTVSLPVTRKRHKARLFFGKVDAPGIVTTDVAPMSFANLRLSCDGGKRSASWKFAGLEDIRQKDGISLTVSDPLFISGLPDRWTKIWSSELNSTGYISIARDASRFYVISSGQVIEYDVVAGKDRKYGLSTDIDLRKVTGEFFCGPDGSLCYADMETGKFIRYDRNRKDWTSSNSKDRVSVHLHHNIVYLDTLCYQMFGYGQHRYSSEVFVWSPSIGKVDSLNIEGLAPRYLAGAAARDGKIYVLGGKGNISGLQELGTQYYDTFTEIDPVEGTAKVLWENNLLKNMVSTKDIVFTDDGKYFLALLYNPEINYSGLQLTRFSTQDGACEQLLPPIMYRFTDVCSDARLCYNKDCDIYLSILCHKTETGKEIAELYILGNPVIASADSTTHHLLTVILTGLLLSAIVSLLIWRKVSRQRRKEIPSGISVDDDLPLLPDEEEPAEVIKEEDTVRGPGIHLLGGFHVYDRNGAEISASFSPVLMQLLAIFVLYTVEKNGLSNAVLKELLWPDKSNDSFNNNKGVNITKLRKLLAQVGDVSIVFEGRLWSINCPPDLCDYMMARQMLGGAVSDNVLKSAMWGPLLPEYHFEWLDTFKSGYDDLVLARLSDISRSSDSPASQVRVADARLCFDSLDEEAVLQKCRALISMGKVGTAKTVFQHFSEEYGDVMGESFNRNFSDFLKK